MGWLRTPGLLTSLVCFPRVRSGSGILVQCSGLQPRSSSTVASYSSASFSLVAYRWRGTSDIGWYSLGGAFEKRGLLHIADCSGGSLAGRVIEGLYGVLSCSPAWLQVRAVAVATISWSAVPVLSDPEEE